MANLPGQPPPSDNVWVGGLPLELEKNHLAQIFEAYGTVVECRMLPPRAGGVTSCGMVRFANIPEAAWVVENLNGNIAQGLSGPIICRFANPHGGKGKDKDGFGKDGFGKDGFGKDGYGKEGYGKDVFGKEGFGKEGFGKDGYGKEGYGKDGFGKDGKGGGGEYGWGGYSKGGGWGKDGGYVVSSKSSPYGGSKGKGHGKMGGGGKDRWGKDDSCWGKDTGKGKSWGKDYKGGKRKVPHSFGSFYGALKGGGHLGSTKIPEENSVYVKNLPHNTSDLDLYKLFAPFGAIAPNGVKAMLGEDGTCKGIGFVDFVDENCAVAAVMALDAFTMQDGSGILCSAKKPSRKGGHQQWGQASDEWQPQGRDEWQTHGEDWSQLPLPPPPEAVELPPFDQELATGIPSLEDMAKALAGDVGDVGS